MRGGDCLRRHRISSTTVQLSLLGMPFGPALSSGTAVRRSLSWVVPPTSSQMVTLRLVVCSGLVHSRRCSMKVFCLTFRNNAVTEIILIYWLLESNFFVKYMRLSNDGKTFCEKMPMHKIAYQVDITVNTYTVMAFKHTGTAIWNDTLSGYVVKSSIYHSVKSNFRIYYWLNDDLWEKPSSGTISVSNVCWLTYNVQRACVHASVCKSGGALLCHWGVVSLRGCVIEGLCHWGVVSLRGCVIEGLCLYTCF